MRILILDTINKTIEVALAGAVTTAEPHFVSSWADSSGTSFEEGSTDGVLNGATDVIVVPSPASGVRRVIKSILVRNADTVDIVLSVKYDNGTSQRIMTIVTLEPGDVWTLDGVFTSTGLFKQGQNVIWGSLDGTLSNQTDLQTELTTLQDNIDLKANRFETVRLNEDVGELKAVYADGHTGAIPRVSLARSDSKTTMPAIGLTVIAGITNGDIQIQSNGLMTGVDTSVWSSGDVLFVDPSTAGELTNVRPTYPNVAHAVGVVAVVGVGNGSLNIAISAHLAGEESGTVANNFAIGDQQAGGKSLTFDNGFQMELRGNPTAARVLTLPDITGTIGVSPETDTYTPILTGQAGSAGAYAASLAVGRWELNQVGIMSTWGRIVLSNKGSWTGQVLISIPDVLGGAAGERFTGIAHAQDGVTFSGTIKTLKISGVPGNSVFNFIETLTDGSTTVFTFSQISNTTDLRFYARFPVAN